LPDLLGLYLAGDGAGLVDESVRLSTGQSATFTFTPAPGASQVRVSLVWTDVPANPGAAKTLVNDLDLEVRDPQGRLLLGNAGLRGAPISQEGGAADRLNNLENVFLPAIPGAYTVTVRGAAVNLDGDPSTPAVDQGFALAMLGTAP
jgi:hypothetical protein